MQGKKQALDLEYKAEKHFLFSIIDTLKNTAREVMFTFLGPDDYTAQLKQFFIEWERVNPDFIKTVVKIGQDPESGFDEEIADLEVREGDEKVIWPVSKETLDEMLAKITEYQAQAIIKIMKTEKFTKHLKLEQ